MSSDSTLFKAPDRYPDPPKNMWYEVPETPVHQEVRPIFPWENSFQKPSRVFVEDNEVLIPIPIRYSDPCTDANEQVLRVPSPHKVNPIFPWENNSPKPSRVFVEDHGAFIPPPVQYPDPSKNINHEFPRAPSPHKVNPIFPWEKISQKSSRVFAEDNEAINTSQVRCSSPSRNLRSEVSNPPSSQTLSPIFPWEYGSQKPSRVFAEDRGVWIPSLVDLDKRVTTEMNTQHKESATDLESHDILPNNNWQSFSRTNAWDEVPEINKYVGGLVNQERVKLETSNRQTSELKQNLESGFRTPNIRFTDIPTGYQRSILPVTPALKRRSDFWGEDAHDNQLPSAEGVPSQEEWVLVSVLIREIIFLLCALGSELTPRKACLSSSTNIITEIKP